MSDGEKIKVGSPTGEGIELTIDGDRIFLAGLWKGKTAKSKKGNFNIFWAKKPMFDQLINEYMGYSGAPESGGDFESPPDDDTVPF